MRKQVKFLGIKWSIVDFADSSTTQHEDNGNGKGLDKVLLTLTIVSYIMKAIDFVNLVLDAIFVKKLFDLDLGDQLQGVPNDDYDGENSDVQEDSGLAAFKYMLLMATFTSFMTTMVFGPLVLKLIESYDPNRFDLTQVDMVTSLRNSYYAYWAYIETSTFLLEDATTIYIYYLHEELIENANFADVANITTSLLSGVISSCTLCCALISFTWKTDMYLKGAMTGFVFVALSLCSCFLGISCLLDIRSAALLGSTDGVSEVDDSSSFGPMVLLFALTYGLGSLVQLRIFFLIPVFCCCPGYCIRWPTSDGFVLEGHLPSAPDPH
jgi:hypothetical protein